MTHAGIIKHFYNTGYHIALGLKLICRHTSVSASASSTEGAHEHQQSLSVNQESNSVILYSDIIMRNNVEHTWKQNIG